MSVNVYNKETDELIPVAGNLDPDLYAKKSDVDAVLNYRESEEQIVGTWNGRTRYQKWITFSSPAGAHTAWTNVAHGIDNMDELLLCDGLAYDGTRYFPLSCYAGAEYHIILSINNTSVMYQNKGYGVQSTLKFKIKLEYTKTTD